MARRIARKIVVAAGIPEDAALGLPRAMLVGDGRLLIQNHRGVVEYSPQRLRVRTALGVMTVEGEGLSIAALGAQDLMAQGTIRQLTL